MVSPGSHFHYRINRPHRGYQDRYTLKDLTMETLFPLIILLASQAFAMATDAAHPPPGSSMNKVSPYREEARRLMEAFEGALQERREQFKERLRRGDTRLIDTENLTGYAHLTKEQLLQHTDTDLYKGTIYKNTEVLRRSENSETPSRGGMDDVQHKTFKVGPPLRTPDHHKQGPGGREKHAPATPEYHFSHPDSHQPSPLFRDHHIRYNDKHNDRQFRVHPMPTRGKHLSKQDTTNDYVSGYRQDSGEVSTLPDRYPYGDSSVDSSRDSIGHDISDHFDSLDSSYDNDYHFYRDEHSGRRPHVFSSEDNNESEPNYMPPYLDEELDSRERLEVEYMGSHDTDRKTPTGKSFRLDPEEDAEVRSDRHEQRKHPRHYSRLQYTSPTSQEADRRKRPYYDIQPSKAKFPPGPTVPIPVPVTPASSAKDVFRPIPPRMEEHIDDYNPKHHILPVRSALQGVTDFYNGTQRECYECSWFPAVGQGTRPVGWDRCRYAFHLTDAAIFGIRPTSCIDNCYTRVDPDNSVHRGCYRGEEGVNPEKLGCNKQGPQRAVYCFCAGGKCNTSNAPAFY